MRHTVSCHLRQINPLIATYVMLSYLISGQSFTDALRINTLMIFGGSTSLRWLSGRFLFNPKFPFIVLEAHRSDRNSFLVCFR